MFLLYMVISFFDICDEYIVRPLSRKYFWKKLLKKKKWTEWLRFS